MKIIFTIFVLFKLALAFEITNHTFYGTASLIDEVKDDIKISFQRFVEKYDKRYENEDEYEKKFSIYFQNFLEVEKHNVQNTKWKKAMNKFSDLSGEEFEEKYGTGYHNLYRPASKSSNFKSILNTVPKGRDWRKHKMITAVKDQGSCGSCWAHAATEQLESYLRLETRNELVNISVQQITSCTPNALQCGGSGGCFGGVPQFGFEYARLVGVVSDDEYPYISGETKLTEVCHYNTSTEKAVVFTRGEETLPHNDYDVIINHLAHKGPLAIAVAVTKAWQHYEGGVFDGCSYDENMALNHAVQLVGYGEDDIHGDFWIVRNSWGIGWGEDGYIRLAREKSVKCGVNTTPLSGTGCKDDGIKAQKVCGMCGILFEATYPIGTDVTNHEEPTIELVL